MGIEIQVNSIEQLCDLMCGKPEEDEIMSTYIIEYTEGDSGSQYLYLSHTDADSVVEVFRRVMPNAEIIQVSKIIKKYSKKF